MSSKRINWVQPVVSVAGIAGVLLVSYVTMNTQSAVRGEQIRRIQDDARRMEATFEKCAGGLKESDKANATRIRLIEREVDGLGPVVKAIKEISDSNSMKLDALLNRGRVLNNGLVRNTGR